MESQKRIFYLVPHSHIDVEWYWTWSTTREWTDDILGRALAYLQRDPDYRFTQDQVVLIKSFWDGLDEEKRAAFRRAIREKRFAITGGMYVQPEVVEPGGESLVRQIVTGQAWLGKTFGVRARCGWFIDTFGQIPQIPQILRRAGYWYNVFWRDIPLDVDFDRIPADFWWESPDGTRILTHWMPGSYGYNSRGVKSTLEHSGQRVFLPYGNDISRPTQDSAEACALVAKVLKELGESDPDVRLASALEYLEDVAAESDGLPILNYDFNPPYRTQDLRGTYDNRIELKKRNRVAEGALFAAEAAAALAHVAGRAYPADELAGLWEPLLFTQFHDTIGGSHSDAVYVPAMERTGAVLEGATRLAVDSLRSLLPPGGASGSCVAVFNPLSWSRSGLCRVSVSGLPGALNPSAGPLRVEDGAGQRVPARLVGGAGADPRGVEFLARDVPASGWKTFRVVAEDAADPEVVALGGQNALEDAHFRVAWDQDTGDLQSIWDKTLGRELLAGPGNVIVAARETSPDMEGNIHLTGEEACSTDYRVLSVEVSEDALARRVRVRSQFQDCTLVRETALNKHAARLDFTTSLEDFSGGDVLIKASFPLNIDWNKAERVCETPFAATPKPEGHFAAQTWADCSDGEWGAALLNQGTPGYWIGKGRLELVLLRSLANYTGYQERGRHLKLPIYETSTDMTLAREHGTHTFTYSLFPHPGTWRAGDLCRLGQGLNVPFVTLSGLPDVACPAQSESLVAFEPDFIMAALRVAEDGRDLLVRGFETRGQTHTVRMQVASWVRQVRRASLLEEPGEPLPLEAGVVQFDCAPHEIVTLLLAH